MHDELAPAKVADAAEKPTIARASGTGGQLGAAIILALLLKIVLMTTFSSGFENDLFVPFVRHFLETFDNPWAYFYQHSVTADQFPYPPLMLYILAVACLPLKLLSAFGSWDNPLLRSFFFKLPTLLCDIGIAWLLVKRFPNRNKQVFWLYFTSPIILYACYMHSQLDLIPTALLFASICMIVRRSSLSMAALVYGLALSTKMHVIAAFPIILIFLFRNHTLKTSIKFALISAGTYLFFALPLIGNHAFQQMVLFNPKQSRMFDTFASIGDLQIYFSILAAFVIYGRFALYSKINADLFDSFLTLIFSLFVLLMVPAPAWYVWITPFLSLFMIKYWRTKRSLLLPFIGISALYLLFFVVFRKSDHLDLAFLDHPIIFANFSIHAQSLVYTLLEAGLLSVIILCYRWGIRSNSIYKYDYAFVIGIGGDSGTGKSTLLGDLKQVLPEKVVELEGDGDHKWMRGDEHWQQYTHLDPKANRLHRQADAILSLKRGRSVERADYNHQTGRFDNAQSVHANDFIVLSGLHAFYLPKMRRLVDLKIFLDPAEAVHSQWKMQRDVNERGYSSAHVADSLERRRADRVKYIIPQAEHADIVIHYFWDDPPESTAEAQDQNELPELRLSVTVDSSFSFDDFVQTLESEGAIAFWDYDVGLSKQQIIFARPVAPQLLSKLAAELIPNLEELVQHDITWADDYRGIVQLVVLLIMSELIREKDMSHVK